MGKDMKYVTAWTIRPENMSASIKRFLEANPVTPGVKLISRLHVLGSGMGFTVWEADDPLAAAKEGLAWSDLIDLKVYPVVDDATIAKALGK
jgi:hypothetical protein